MKLISCLTLFFFLSLNACVSYKPVYVRNSQNLGGPSLESKKSYRITVDNGKQVSTGINGFKIESDQIIIQNRYSHTTIPMTQIAQIDQAKVDPLKTTFLAGGIVLGIMGTIVLVALSSWPAND